MKSSVFEKQAEEAIAELVMGSENSAGVHCPDNIRELLLNAYKAGGYQYAKMLEVERVGRIEYLTHRFGNNIAGRLEKIREEFTEMVEAYENATTCEDFDDFIDEMADTTLVLFHLAGIFSLSQGDLVDMALEKVMIRETNPNYKRTTKS